MFKKKDGVRSTGNNEIPARLIKKGGRGTGTTSYSGFVQQNQQSYPELYKQPTYNKPLYDDRAIPANDVSESYLSNNKHWQQSASAPSSTKATRRKFAPSFLFKKKNHEVSSQHDYAINVTEIEEEDETDIARLEDFADQESIDPVMLGQLDDSQLNSVSEENFDKMYKRRVDFILTNYQKPPPYPGITKDKKQNNKTEPTKPQLDVDTPLLRQLLKDTQLTDNASMNNFWQAGPGGHVQQSDRSMHVNDKLVSRTQNITTSIKNNSNSKELFEKRKQHYNLLTINETGQQPGTNMTKSVNENNRDAISEIIYPAKDYDQHHVIDQPMSLSASVPNLSMQHTDKISAGHFTTPRKPRDRIEPGEMEALIAHYRKTSLDTFEPYGMNSESISLYSEGSSSYVPPSPYMSAEIPDWLQVYAKASPELDQYLKWEMFRYPELDCWQTMLKRLYKKELEQVVLWFEEYRLALCNELNQQENLQMQQQQGDNMQIQQDRMLGLHAGLDVKKTNV